MIPAQEKQIIALLPKSIVVAQIINANGTYQEIVCAKGLDKYFDLVWQFTDQSGKDETDYQVLLEERLAKHFPHSFLPENVIAYLPKDNITSRGVDAYLKREGWVERAPNVRTTFLYVDKM